MLKIKKRILVFALAIVLLCAAVPGFVATPSNDAAQLLAAQLNAVTYEASPYLTLTNVSELYAAGITGKRADGTRVRVAVIDTGIDVNHAAFKDADGNSIISPLSYNATTKQCVADAGYSVIQDEYVSGEGYHGTAVCGLIASQLTDYRGTAPDCELVVIRCAWGTDGFENADLFHAIEYALSVDCSVISISWGISNTEEANAALSALVAQAKEKNCTIVCAAGNTCNTNLTLPALLPDVICVGAVDKNKAKAVYSNYGPGIDVVAPGNVMAVQGGGNVYRANGTSFAAPIVAGIAALYYSQHPDATVQDVTYALTFTAEDLGSAGVDNLFGYGLVNALGAVTARAGTLTLLSGNQYWRIPFYYEYPVQNVPTLAQEGATFDGWFLDESYRRQVTFPMQFTQDVTLIARWKYTCAIYIDDQLVRTDSYYTGNIISYPAKNGFDLVIPDKPTYMGTQSLELRGTWVLKDITVNDVSTGVLKEYDGQPVTLTLDATHTLSDALTFTWYRDDELLPDQTSNTLTLTGLPEDSGVYRCVASVTAEGQTKTETADFAVYIDPIMLDVPAAADAVYTGAVQTPSFTDYDSALISAQQISAADAGEYEITFTVSDPCYTFASGNIATATWLITPAQNELLHPADAAVTLTVTLTDVGDKSSEPVYAVPEDFAWPAFAAKWGTAETDADASSFTEPGTYVVTFTTEGTDDYTSCRYDVTLVVNAPPAQSAAELPVVWIVLGIVAALGICLFLVRRKK